MFRGQGGIPLAELLLTNVTFVEGHTVSTFARATRTTTPRWVLSPQNGSLTRSFVAHKYYFISKA